ncbi:MAG: 5'/3'-nucleotidase SurE [Anaerolineaceae bacterium]|nr:5'/3'-nucleotidase SurE [Anaerolineaceae bacterium]
MKRILLTNDDGVSAPGLLAMAQALRKMEGAQVTVLAPDKNWSACGHNKTLGRPLRLRQTTLADGSLAWSSDGAPSDCVALALLGALEQDFDFVVSGINPNANVGLDVTYSGTVTAAMEAGIGGLPGFAVSIDAPEFHRGDLDYVAAAQAAAALIEKLMEKEEGKQAGSLLRVAKAERTHASEGAEVADSERAAAADGYKAASIWNINIPYRPEGNYEGVRFTRQGIRLYHDALEKRIDPRGAPYYWLGGDPPSGVVEEGTDYGAIKQGFISVTPLHMSMTDYEKLDGLGQTLL